MHHKLEVVFVQASGTVSKLISKVSKAIYRGNYTGSFVPSHVLLVLDNSIVFEASTYKQAGNNNEKVVEKGTRLLLLDDIDERAEDSIICRCTISDNCDPYLALKYVARASNYHYSYGSIIKFLMKGHLAKDTGKSKDEYICSGLVLDALREPVFDNNPSLRYVTNKFKGIDSNSVTPLDLFLTFAEAGFCFITSKGYINVDNL